MPKSKSPRHESGFTSEAAMSHHTHSKPCKARIGMHNEAPHWIRQPYILFGYRLGFSLLESIMSPFMLHNETGTSSTSQNR